MNKKDVIIVGAGPSGIFTAYELLQLNNNLKITIIEKGKPIEKRNCPINKIGKCIQCKPCCNITCGFAGAGAFSDAKLSLYDKDSEEVLVGGNLPTIIGNQETKNLIDYCDKIYLQFGADPKIEGIENKNEILEIKNKAKENNINLIDTPIRHLGTEKSRELYYKLEQYLISNKVEIKYEYEVTKLLITNNEITGVFIENIKDKNKKEILYSDKVVLAVGRVGSGRLFKMCEINGIKTNIGTVDIGIRYEMKTEKGIEDINRLMYEGKFIYNTKLFNDKVRTFCQNPGGYVTQEVYNSNLSLANGHSFKEKKSENTNLAILSSHNFTEPFKDPIGFGKRIGKTTNMLGDGAIIVQRFGDLLKGKRTWDKDLKNNSVIPTLKGIQAGDLSLAFPYRTLSNIIDFIQQMDKVVPGFANEDNLMYGPEIKFYSNAIELDKNLMTNIKGLYAIGDGAGLTRGLMMASCSGVYLARKLI